MGLRAECGVLRGGTSVIALLSTGLSLSSLNAVYVTIQLLRKSLFVRPEAIFQLKFSAYISLVFLGLSIGLIIAGLIMPRFGTKSAIALGQVLNAISFMTACKGGDLTIAISRLIAGASFGLQLTPCVVHLGLMLRRFESLWLFTALHVIPFIALSAIHIEIPIAIFIIVSILISVIVMVGVKEFISLKPPTSIRAYDVRNHLIAILPATPLALLVYTSSIHAIHGDVMWMTLLSTPLALYAALKGRVRMKFVYAPAAFIGYALAAFNHSALAVFPLMTSFIAAFHDFSTRMLFTISPLYTYVAITSSLSLTTLYSALLLIVNAYVAYTFPIAPFIISAFLTAVMLHVMRSNAWSFKGAIITG